TQTVEAAKADAERIKVLGLAEATAIGDVGKADAERMLAKAKIVMVGDGGATGDIARLASSMTPALRSLTGLDLAQVMQRLHPDAPQGNMTHHEVT
ncbi:Uncharacterized protein OBRU01_07168, partial [Operophtera brumata]